MSSRSLTPTPRDAGDLIVAGFQSETEALSYEGEPKMARRTLFVIAGAIALALGAASLVKIDRIVVATGQLVTNEPTMVVQSLNKAIIRSIDVREGDRVKAGQTLATLDSTFATADLAQLSVQIESLNAEIARLDAEQAERPMDQAVVPARYAELQTALMAQRKAQRTEQLRSFDGKIAQADASIVKLQADQRRFVEREKVVREIELMRQKLTEMQYGSRLTLLQAIDQKLEILRNADFQANALLEARKLRETAVADRDAFIEQWRASVSADLVQRRTTRDAAVEQLAKASKNEDLVNLKAPRDAIVLKVAKLSVGSVLMDATPLITLTPADAPVEAEVSVDARDIGFLRADDPVVVKIEAFNYLEHGSAAGRVRTLSEDAFTTQEATGSTPVRPYYRANVAIDRAQLHNVPSGFRLIAGMPVTADIKVGERTLLSYLTRGITRGLDESMREP